MPKYPDLLAEAKDLRERATVFEGRVFAARADVASDQSALVHVEIENEAYQARHAYNEAVLMLEALR